MIDIIAIAIDPALLSNEFNQSINHQSCIVSKYCTTGTRRNRYLLYSTVNLAVVPKEN